nr:MAG TPA: hypothetical protein [Caudoviricetes sp.]
MEQDTIYGLGNISSSKIAYCCSRYSSCFPRSGTSTNRNRTRTTIK